MAGNQQRSYTASEKRDALALAVIDRPAPRGIAKIYTLLQRAEALELAAKDGVSAASKELFDAHPFVDVGEMQRRLATHLHWYNQRRTNDTVASLSFVRSSPQSSRAAACASQSDGRDEARTRMHCAVRFGPSSPMPSGSATEVKYRSKSMARRLSSTSS